jgi:hypothetical protein
MLYDRPAQADLITAIWDDATGETWAQALDRFGTYGALIDAKAAREYLAAGGSDVVMSFGYGDDPEYFDEVTLDDLTQDVEEEPGGQPALDAENDACWGPFAVWHNPSLV